MFGHDILHNQLDYQIYTPLERYHRIMLNKLIIFIKNNYSDWKINNSPEDKLSQLKKIKYFLDESYLFKRPEEEKIHISAYTTYKKLYHHLFEMDYIRALESKDSKRIMQIETHIISEFESDIRHLKSNIGIGDKQIIKIEKLEGKRIGNFKTVLYAASFTLLFLISNVILATTVEKDKNKPYQTEYNALNEIKPLMDSLLNIIPDEALENGNISHWSQFVEFESAKEDSINVLLNRIGKFLESRNIIDEYKLLDIFRKGYDEVGKELEEHVRKKAGPGYHIIKQEIITNNGKKKITGTNISSEKLNTFLMHVNHKTNYVITENIHKKQKKLSKLFNKTKYKTTDILEEVFSEEFSYLQVILTKKGTILFVVVYDESRKITIKDKIQTETFEYTIKVEIVPDGFDHTLL